MQFTKIFKNITLITFILLSSITFYAQEDGETEVNSDTVSVISPVKERKFKLFDFLKKKDKKEIEDENIDEPDDSINTPKRKTGFFSFLKRKNKKDTIPGDSISSSDSTTVVSDSINTKEKFSLFKKNKNDTTKGGGAKPEKIRPGKWIKMNAEEQDSLLRAWDAYDKEHYKKKYAFTKKEVEIALKRDRNPFEKLIYKRARNKPFKHRKKLITRQNNRYKKTLKYDRLNKSETAPSDSVSDARRYQIVNKRYKREAKKEAIRKNKVVIKYDRKEERLRGRYELSDNERVVLNKGKGMRLKGSELLIFKKARKKQENFTVKLLKLRKSRSFALQSENVKERMKENDKKMKERDKERYSSLFKKKKEKNENKHDSSEYPKRYHK
ncbi:MAG: hypothetical protein L3J35_11885 [Bacteroidales bacterium]|nr:hypothetical protein [Bacteroidales bacterium]